jgi:uncharacterized membrane protein
MIQQLDRRSHLDLQINLLAEQESTSALKLLNAIAEHLEVSDLPDEESRAARAFGGLIDGVQNVTE